MIVEYITQQDMTPAGGAEERPYFNADSTALEVNLQNSAGTTRGTLRNGNGFRYFVPKESIRVLSFGIVFPYSYSLSSSIVRLSFTWVDSALGANPVYEFTGNIVSGLVGLPYDGAEFPVDVTIPFPPLAGTNNLSFVAGLGSGYAKVSMINAPSKLDFAVTGKSLFAWVFWKVAHSLPMVAG